MSYRQVKIELEKAIHEINKEADSCYGIPDESGDIYAQGLEDAINYLDNLVLLVSELANDEQYEEMKNRTVPASDEQLRLF